MIIRFDNLDDINYSGQYVFDRNGFHHANYDYTTTGESISDADLIPLSQRDKICFGFLPNRPFAYLSVFPAFNFWTSFKYTVSYKSGYYDVVNCETVDSADCEDYYVSCDDYSYSGFVNCWTSGNVYVEKFNDSSYCDFSFFKYRNSDCYNLFPVLGFKNSIYYPKFRIYAKDFGVIPNFNCKFNLFLHLFNFDDSNHKFIFNKTVKIGAFGSIDEKCFFENFYGERAFLDNVSKPIFDLTNFFNTVIFDNGSEILLSDFLFDNKFEVPIYNVNAFGDCFAFEVKEEVDFGTMSGLDCQCLTTAINSLNTTLESLLKNSSDDNIVDVLDDFHKSFTHAFNKTLITQEYSFGSGSVFKSNDLDNHDYYYLIDNKGKTCLSPIFIDKCDSDDLGSSAQKPLYISNTDIKGSSCNNPLYLNLCDMPAIKINDLFNRISVGSIDIASLPLDYTSLISSLLGSIITALGNLLKPSDTLTIALPNIQISNMPSIDINSMPNINISNSSSSPVNISLTNGLSCNDPLHVDLCPFAFTEVPVRINSIPSLDVDIDTMPVNRTVTHLNSAVDISCICDELDDIDKGLVAEFAALGVSLDSIKSAVDGVGNKFVTSCDTSIGQAFGEAFNLTNCVGSVFKAHDNNWNGEDTLSGILYKQLDYSYVINNDINSAFYSRYFIDSVNGLRYFSLPSLIHYAFFKSGSIGNYPNTNYSVFCHDRLTSFSDVLKRALFIGQNSANFTNADSVFSFYNSNPDSNKILNHACNVNPCSLKFCDNSLPVDIVNPSNNPVKVEMEPTSSPINVNVESAPADGDSIFINSDGKTLLNTSNFR